MVFDLVNNLGTASLNGRLLGRRHFGQICQALTEVPPGEVVFLDFASIDFVTGSWINACLVPLLVWSADEQHDLYPVITGLAAEWVDEFRTVATFTNECFMLGETDLSKGELIGELEPAQLEAMQHVMRLQEVTGAGLEHHCSGRVRATAWNNRLRGLSRKRLVRRTSQGREQRYRPLVKELFYGRQLLASAGG